MNAQAKADFISTTFQNLVKGGFFGRFICGYDSVPVYHEATRKAYELCEQAWVQEERVLNRLDAELEHGRTHCAKCDAKLLEDTDEVGLPTGGLYCGLCDPKETK